MVCCVADMYNVGMTVKEIIENTGYGHTTIHKWLKQAASIGICGYDPLESKRRSRRLVQKPIHQYDMTGNFISWFESQKDAEDKTGTNTSGIQAVLKKRKKSAGGFLWFYADDPEQPDKSKIIL